MIRKGFTLVEILIVVLILGILAAITLPKLSNASAVARASMLADDLRIFRIQIAVFKGQHIGVSPGYPGCDTDVAPTAEAFVDHLTLVSMRTGETAPVGTAGFEYGPYLAQMPANPVNGKTSVQIIADAGAIPEAADDSDGWIYKPATLTIKADSIGTDDSGKDYFDY